MPKKLTAREHWDRAFHYYFKRDRRRTIREAQLAMTLDPNLVRPHWVIAQVYLNSDPIDPEAALREFRVLVRKDPYWAEGHASLAGTLLKQGRKAEALKSIREVLRLKPKSQWARVEMSKHLLERGEYREAVAVLQAKPSAPHFCTMVDAHLLMAELMKDYALADARAKWEFILTLDETIPANRVAQVEARKRLQETQPAGSPRPS